MTNLEEFQQLHGEEWARILQSGAFSAGMIHLSVSFLHELSIKTDEEITKNAVVILADIRGKLRYESSLLALGVPASEPIPELREEYVNQEKEFAEEQARINRTPIV